MTATDAMPPADPQFQGQELRILNWTDYLDPELVAEFERHYGVKLQFTYFETDEHRDRLIAENGPRGHDLAIVDSSRLGLYRKQGWIAPFEQALLPRVTRLHPSCLASTHDSAAYSVPYFWGTLGIAYRRDLLGHAIDRWQQLYQPEEALRGKIVMLDDAGEVLGMAAKTLGYSMNAKDPQVWKAAAQLARAQKPYVYSYGTVALDEDSTMVSGEVWMAQIYNGEVRMLQEHNKHILYVHPAEGSGLWVDHWVLFASAPHRELAHAFLNFINTPEHAAANAQTLSFATCNQTAEPLLPVAFRADPVVYPPPEVMQQEGAPNSGSRPALAAWPRMWWVTAPQRSRRSCQKAAPGHER